MAESYTKIKLIGEGSFGKCWLVKCKSDGSHAVIKQMNILNLSEDEELEAYKEVKVLEKLNHPNIIKSKYKKMQVF